MRLSYVPSASNTCALYPCYALTLQASNATSTVVATPARSLSCVPGSYRTGEQISLTATPSGTLHFSGWSGYVSSAINPLVITMPAAAIGLNATFN